MDAPNRQVSWLENFPPDIWAYFAIYLPGEQLGRLMMTGATFLWKRLKFPHVVKSINLGRDFIVFKSLPKFLNDFPSLEELHIHSIAVNWSHKLGLKLDLIPSGLRKLELSGTWGELSSTLFGKDCLTFKLDERLPRLEALDLRRLSFRSYSWMVHSPQSLTNLTIQHWDGSVELPPSLIHFEGYMVDISTSSFLSKLPPSLETFYAHNLSGLELIVPLLPPSTRKLFLAREPGYSDGPIPEQNLLEQLPQSLTWLEIPKIDEINFGTNPELTALLPPTLTELRVPRDLPCSVWQLLPQPLTNLAFQAKLQSTTVTSKTMDSHGVQQVVRSIPFDYFPRSITNLQLSSGYFFCGPPTIPSNRSYFPPQLTHLEMEVLQLAPETAKLLPSSLTFLEIGNLCERVCEHLPNSLKKLVSQPALITPNLIKFLPKSLTSLRLLAARADDAWHDCKTGKTIDPVSELPEYSIQEQCLSSDFDWTHSSPLPSTLTELYIRNVNELGDTFLQHHQLPNLVTLDLARPKHFTDTSIPLLSPSLTILELEHASKISGKSFEFLPTGLTSLNLANSESIFDSDIQHLPRTLSYVLLNQAIHLTDSCIPDLPPHLKSLIMESNSQITTSCFDKLPYPLRSSQYYRAVIFANWSVSFGKVVLE